MPGIDPWVFLGEAELQDGGGTSFAFQDSVSYVRFGSRLDLSEDHEEISVYFLTHDSLSSILDVASVAREVAAAARRAEALNFPTLPVLRDGWVS